MVFEETPKQKGHTFLQLPHFHLRLAEPEGQLTNRFVLDILNYDKTMIEIYHQSRFYGIRRINGTPKTY